MQIALFKNVRQVMRIEALCRQMGIPVTIVPVPEQLSSECGMCLRVDDPVQKERLSSLCQQQKVEVFYGEV